MLLILPGVTGFAGYQNDTGTTDGNGIPGHTIAIVVGGGDPLAICTAISERKVRVQVRLVPLPLLL